jgi:hypothetical protein
MDLTVVNNPNANSNNNAAAPNNLILVIKSPSLLLLNLKENFTRITTTIKIIIASIFVIFLSYFLLLNN